LITINLDKAKMIAHEKRRFARSEEFKPHDEVIANSPEEIKAIINV